MVDHTDYPYDNPASQEERKRIVRNDRASTFFQQALADAGMVGGRWTKQNEARVTGAAQYPRADLPAWVGADCGVEEPLGYAIDDHPPVGSHAEVEASIERLHRKRED
jgi:hypothetical protein